MDEKSRFDRSGEIAATVHQVAALRQRNEELEAENAKNNALAGEVQGLHYVLAKIYSEQIAECECGGGDCDVCQLLAEDVREFDAGHRFVVRRIKELETECETKTLALSEANRIIEGYERNLADRDRLYARNEELERQVRELRRELGSVYAEMVMTLEELRIVRAAQNRMAAVDGINDRIVGVTARIADLRAEEVNG